MKHLKTEDVETAQDESRSAEFETLFQEHWARVYRLLQRLVGDPAEAEDLALETFLRLYKQHPGQEDGFNPGGWLHRVATNLGLHSIRSWKRREHYETDGRKICPGKRRRLGAGRDPGTGRRTAPGAPGACQMNEKQSQLLILRYSGLSYKEIASTLQPCARLDWSFVGACRA